MRRRLSGLTIAAAILSISSVGYGATQLPADPDASPNSIQQATTMVLPELVENTGLNRKINREVRKGNNSWAGYYRLYQHSYAPRKDYQSINTSFSVGARLFGKELEGLRVVGNGVLRKDSNTSYTYTYAQVGGRFLHSERKTGGAGQRITTTYVKYYPKTLFDISKTFTLYFIPVKVRGTVKLVGSVDTKACASLSSSLPCATQATSLYARSQGRAEIVGEMTASTSLYYVSAGVTGRVHFVDITPSNWAGFTHRNGNVYWRNYMVERFETLHGEVEVWAKAFGHEWRKEILSWPSVWSLGNTLDNHNTDFLVFKGLIAPIFVFKGF
ncbi:MAG: hypothetical protein JRH20_32285 [Deltaproteobacteria bacterium]|nr:hypothetical protein [Deltaproteobacteria bacterium]